MKILVIMMSSLLDQHVFAGPVFTSGGERRLFEMIRQFAANGHDVTILTNDAGQAVLGEEGVRARIVAMPYVPLDRNNITQIGTVLTYLMRILYSLKLRNKLQGNFDVITSATGLLPDVWTTFILSKRYKNAKCFVHIHHLSNGLHRSTRLKADSSFGSALFRYLSALQQAVAIKLIGHAGFTVFTFPSMVSSIRIRGIPSKYIRTMENGVNLSLAREIKATTAIDGIFIGRVSRKKGIYDLITVWKNVCAEFPEAKLAIVGPIEDLHVEHVIHREGLERNIFLAGRVQESRKFELLKSAKVFLFPSFEEGWGISVSEALACGIPVIAYDLSAYVYASDSIVRIEQSNKAAFTSAICQLLSNESMRRSLGTKGIHLVKDWKQVLQQELATIVREIEHPER